MPAGAVEARGAGGRCAGSGTAAGRGPSGDCGYRGPDRFGHLIAERTRAALAQKKEQGALLGNRTNLAEAQAKGVAGNRVVADVFAANVLPIVQQIQASGATTTRAIAAALNARGIRTARGGAWHNSTVRNSLARAGESLSLNEFETGYNCQRPQRVESGVRRETGKE